MDILALALSIIGCLNWGLVGIFQFDLVPGCLALPHCSAASFTQSSAWLVCGAFPSFCVGLGWETAMNKKWQHRDHLCCQLFYSWVSAGLLTRIL